MNIGDLISYRGAPHIVVGFEQSVPVARPDLEQVILKNTKTLETRRVPMKWFRPHWRKQ